MVCDKLSFPFSVSGTQRSSLLLSFGESDGRPDAAVVPHPCQDVAQPYCVPFPTEAETSHQNTELNDIETGSDSDIVYVSEHVPVSVSVPVSQLPPKRIIQVHRLNIKKDLIDLFRDPLIMSQDIEIIVIDARGVEEVGRGVGLLRDVFSLFWKETYDSLFVGENERVPFVRHDYQRDEWVAVGRILVKGYLTCQYLPVLLSQTFLACLFWGNLQ